MNGSGKEKRSFRIGGVVAPSWADRHGCIDSALKGFTITHCALLGVWFSPSIGLLASTWGSRHWQAQGVSIYTASSTQREVAHRKVILEVNQGVIVLA